MLDHISGSLLGLALGDALGAPFEFAPRGSFLIPQDLVGGGPFSLPAGYWTDDTSMALCLAESLIEQKGNDPIDQARRYVRWWQEGYMSSTGKCFDIGSTTQLALESFWRLGTLEQVAVVATRPGNGSLMRLAPVSLAYSHDLALAREMSALSSTVTHPSLESVDACRILGVYIAALVNGKSREEIFSQNFFSSYLEGYLKDEGCIALANGSWKSKSLSTIQAAGTAKLCLEAAIFCFMQAEDFAQGAQTAVSLGEDTDTVGAIYGQLAGAYWGEHNLPSNWLKQLHEVGLIRSLARSLWFLAQDGPVM